MRTGRTVITAAVVAEPASGMLLLAGLAGLAGWVVLGRQARPGPAG